MRTRAAIALLILTSCTTTTTGTGQSSSSSASSSSGGPLSPTVCRSRCQTKALSCDSTTDPTETCDAVCDTFTSEQVACLESKSCAELEGGYYEELCPP